MSQFRDKMAVSIFFTAAGTAMLALGLVLFWQAKDFVQTTKQTSGKVVGLEQRYRKAGMFGAVFAFTDASGTLRTNHTSSEQNPPAYKIGEVIKVRYQPENPETARIESFHELWLYPTISVGAGLIFAVVGACVLVLVLRERRQEQ